MSSRTLVLMRHAKAESYAEDDHHRGLTKRGHADAGATGAWLAERGLVPTHALVSSATRTRETWADVAAASGSTASARFDDGLYAGGPETVHELVVTIEPDATVLLVVGHNPTTAYLAQTLTDAAVADPTAFRDMSRDFPTAAAAVFELDGEWADVVPGTGRLTAFWSPSGR